MFRIKTTYAKLTALVALTFAFAAVSIAKTHSDAKFSQIKISNFGQMDDRFYRGARPKEKDFAALKDLGIHTVIDLTDNTEKERGYVEAQGMKYVNIAIPDKQGSERRANRGVPEVGQRPGNWQVLRSLRRRPSPHGRNGSRLPLQQLSLELRPGLQRDAGL